MTSTRSAVRLLLASAVLSSALAFAQSDAPPPPPPPPSQELVPAAPQMQDGGRVRWGVSGNVGLFLPQTAVMFGAQGRVGYQISNPFGVYAQFGFAAGFGVGGSASATGASASISAAAFWHLGVLAEYTLGDHISFGAGPALASGGWAGVAASVMSNGQSGQTTTTALAAGGYMPALDFKFSFHTGNRNPINGRIGGFNIGIDLMVLFATNSVYTQSTVDSAGNKVSADVVTNGLAVGLVPTISIGYDGR